MAVLNGLHGSTHGQVAELTSILSQDLGAIKDIVNENVSRDRGFRALSEVIFLPLKNVCHLHQMEFRLQK